MSKDIKVGLRVKMTTFVFSIRFHDNPEVLDFYLHACLILFTIVLFPASNCEDNAFVLRNAMWLPGHYEFLIRT